MSLVNYILRTALRRRIGRIDAYRERPFEAQEKIFQSLIEAGKETHWGIQHQYTSIRNVDDYARLVPVSAYEQLYPFIERMMMGETHVLWNAPVNWFAKSSGTTNAKSKFIPVSEESLKETHYKGGKDLLTSYFINHPDAKMFGGKGLGVGGSYQTSHFRADSFYGDISAVIMANLPKWAEFRRAPSIEVALMNEWEAKIQRITTDVQSEYITNISGVPTWTVVLLEKMLELTGKSNVLEIWPDFEVFFHGAVAFQPYKPIFKKLFPGDQVRYYETYNASEGFFAFQDQEGSEDLLLMLDNGIYYEFIPSEDFDSDYPKTIRLDEVELGKNYALVISTNAGLWRYKIGDTVRFTSLKPFRIRITGRTKHFINAFGEEVVIENAETALSEACAITHASVKNFTAAPVYFGDNSKGAHEWIIEFAHPPKNLQEFAVLLDAELQKLNSDYEAKRHKNLALEMPRIHAVPENTFYNWLKLKGKLGGQHKVPRLSNDREYVDEILKMLHK